MVTRTLPSSNLPTNRASELFEAFKEAEGFIESIKKSGTFRFEFFDVT